ncbi:MAG: hypothetical protein UW22_C0074G0002 [Candidatus Gottesmanbacteria bacterium GW2011_GWB1_44_11c]|uniref:Uncharacterized protein n=1 Tax=Candidatus Gottesmanbacteria bacterium GW2011_GWB1_44_11c TaxID=1618447 RepID=A0A0G1IRP2_9BACT|nr:MAG: hypothetical protein UW22_C0074G0002 [Candidatus Gottesmanbacteria bacterium GW2011_GWB1_44_11c]
MTGSYSILYDVSRFILHPKKFWTFTMGRVGTVVWKILWPILIVGTLALNLFIPGTITRVSQMVPVEPQGITQKPPSWLTKWRQGVGEKFQEWVPQIGKPAPVKTETPPAAEVVQEQEYVSIITFDDKSGYELVPEKKYGYTVDFFTWLQSTPSLHKGDLLIFYDTDANGYVIQTEGIVTIDAEGQTVIVIGKKTYQIDKVPSFGKERGHIFSSGEGSQKVYFRLHRALGGGEAGAQLPVGPVDFGSLLANPPMIGIDPSLQIPPIPDKWGDIDWLSLQWRKLAEAYYAPSPQEFIGIGSDAGSTGALEKALETHAGELRKQMLDWNEFPLIGSGLYGYRDELKGKVGNVLVQTRASEAWIYLRDQAGVGPKTRENLNENQRRIFDMTDGTPPLSSYFVSPGEFSGMTVEEMLATGKYLAVIATHSPNDFGRVFMLYRTDGTPIGPVIVGSMSADEEWIGGKWLGQPAGKIVRDGYSWAFDFPSELYTLAGGTGQYTDPIIAIEANMVSSLSVAPVSTVVVCDDLAMKQDMQTALNLFNGTPLAPYLPSQITIDKRDVGSLGENIYGKMLSTKQESDGSVVSTIALTDQYKTGGHLNPQELARSFRDKGMSVTDAEIIAAYTEDPAIGAIIHEIMHGVSKRTENGKIVASDLFKAFQGVFYVGNSNEDAVTHYANSYSNIDVSSYLERQYEDFSDVMTLYRIAPTLLQQLDPEKYAFADMLFNGDVPISQIDMTMIRKSVALKHASPLTMMFVTLGNTLPGLWTAKQREQTLGNATITFVKKRLAVVWPGISKAYLSQASIFTKINVFTRFVRRMIQDWADMIQKQSTGPPTSLVIPQFQKPAPVTLTTSERVQAEGFSRRQIKKIESDLKKEGKENKEPIIYTITVWKNNAPAIVWEKGKPGEVSMIFVKEKGVWRIVSPTAQSSWESGITKKEFDQKVAIWDMSVPPVSVSRRSFDIQLKAGTGRIEFEEKVIPVTRPEPVKPEQTIPEGEHLPPAPAEFIPVQPQPAVQQPISQPQPIALARGGGASFTQILRGIVNWIRQMAALTPSAPTQAPVQPAPVKPVPAEPQKEPTDWDREKARIKERNSQIERFRKQGRFVDAVGIAYNSQSVLLRDIQFHFGMGVYNPNSFFWKNIPCG